MLRFREPKYPRWGFEYPNPDLVKIVIDTRSPHNGGQQYTPAPLNNVSNISGQSGQLHFRGTTFKGDEKIGNFPPLYVS